MRTRPFTVLCDVDGVLADLVGKLCDELALRGKVKTPADFKHHDFKTVLNETELEIVYDVMSKPGFCFDLPWHAGARDFITDLRIELAANDNELLIVTSPWWSPTWQHERREWLRPAGMERRVCGVPTPYKKHMRGDVLIEDHAGTLYDWLEANPSGMGILISRPWNSFDSNEFKAHERMEIVCNYQTALHCVEARISRNAGFGEDRFGAFSEAA